MSKRTRVAPALVGALVLLLGLAGTAAAGARTGTATDAATRPARCPVGVAQPPGDVCIAKGNAMAAEILAGIREVYAAHPYHGAAFGVWVGERPILSGALGESVTGVPATRDMRFRIGNAGETIMTTLLLMMVDDGEVSLDDTVSEWFPQFPAADAVTLHMLATSTSGYADFVTTAEFNDAFEANPFRVWTPDEVLAIAMKQPMHFAPGTSWAFSDTNFVLLGEILERVSGRPYGELVTDTVLDALKMRSTRYTTTSAIPSPVLHAYSNERGIYEETTYWSPSWVTYAATFTSTVDDLGKLARSVGTGKLLSKESHQLQVGDENVGLGPLTEETYYAMGLAVSHGWLAANPQIDGYTGIVAYYPPAKVSVVVAATFDQGGDIATHYAALLFNRIGEIVAPDSPPALSACPRGC